MQTDRMTNMQKKNRKTDNQTYNRSLYRLSKKQLPILYSKLLYKLGNYLLDIQYVGITYNTDSKKMGDESNHFNIERRHKKCFKKPFQFYRFTVKRFIIELESKILSLSDGRMDTVNYRNSFAVKKSVTHVMLILNNRPPGTWI